jgi:hypothetical protein
MVSAPHASSSREKTHKIARNVHFDFENEQRRHVFPRNSSSDLGARHARRRARGTRFPPREVHAASAMMVAEASRGVETRSARKRKRDLDAQAGVAFPGLPFDVAVSIVEKHLHDPADLAVLRAVSRGMRDAVDATGRKGGGVR